MRVQVRLFATLASFVEGARIAEPMPVDLPENSDVATLLEQLRVPADTVHLVAVNGRPVHDFSIKLHPADRIGLFPPVGGG